MMNEQDLKQIAQKGITEEQIKLQLKQFETGFPFLKLEAAAAIGNGIITIDEEGRKHYEQLWNDYKAAAHQIVKFVPASGAASRMFKDMFSFANADYDVPTTPFEKKYFDDLENFAFYNALNETCKQLYSKDIKQLTAEEKAYW